MQSPIHPEYTSHLVGAPGRRHWPLTLLAPVGITAVVAGASFVIMVISMLPVSY